VSLQANSLVVTLRLEKMAGKILHQAQTAFVQGRNIMNSVLALHEILHETKKEERLA
jgi:hypothetical protein